MSQRNVSINSVSCTNPGCLFRCESRFALLRHKCTAGKKRKVGAEHPLFNMRNDANDGNNIWGNRENVVDRNVLPDNDECHGVEEMEERKLEGKLSVIDEFCKIVMDCSDYNSLKMVKNIIELICSDQFDVDVFRSRIPSLQSCLAYGKNKFSERAAEDGFRKNVVQYNVKNETYTAEYFSRNILTVLRDQVACASSDDILWNPHQECSRHSSERSSAQSFGSTPNTHPMQLNYFKEQHKKRMLEVMTSTEADVMWHNCGNKQSFVGFLQMFTDKTVTTLKIGGIAAHVVHATFLNFSKRLRKKLIHEGKTIVGFLPTGTKDVEAGVLKVSDRTCIEQMTDGIIEDVEDDVVCEERENVIETDADEEIVALMDKVLLTSTTAGRRIKLGILHNSMLNILKPALTVCVRGFHIAAFSRTWVCHPMFMSYCCDIPEAKDMSAVRNSLNTNFPCHRCLVSNEDIKNLSSGYARLYSGTRRIRQEMLKHIHSGVPEDCRKEDGKKYALSELCDNILKKESVYPLPSFLEVIMEQYPSFLPSSMYEILTFEPLHNLHLGISKLLKTMTFELIGSDKPVRFLGTSKKGRVKFCSKRVPVLRACNSLLRAMQDDCTTRSIHIDFSTKEASSALNGIFLQTGIRGMLEGKDYRNLDYVFPFVAAFVDRISGCEEGGITAVHTLYSNLLFKLFTEIENDGISYIELRKIEALVRRLKKECKRLFDPYVKKGLYTLKFHLLDHLVEDLGKYGSLDYLNGGPYEYFNAVVKQHYRDTSKRKPTALEETANHLSRCLQKTDAERDGSKQVVSASHCASNENRDVQRLARDGLRITLRQLKSVAENHSSMPRTGGLAEILAAVPLSDISVMIQLTEEHLKTAMVTALDFGVSLTLVKTGYIEAIQTPSLSSFDYEKCRVLFSIDGVRSKSKKRVFATSSFGSSRTSMYSTVFIRGGSEGDKDEFWFAKVLVLFRLTVESGTYDEDLAFVQYYVPTPPRDEIDNILDCICLRWETEDGEDHSSDKVADSSIIEAGENYGLIPFKSICGTCDLVRTNYAIHPFTTELPWTHHKFYVNRFI